MVDFLLKSTSLRFKLKDSVETLQIKLIGFIIFLQTLSNLQLTTKKLKLKEDTRMERVLSLQELSEDNPLIMEEMWSTWSNACSDASNCCSSISNQCDLPVCPAGW